MKRRVAIAMLLAVLFGCCSYCALLWRDYTSHKRDLERLRAELFQLRKISRDNEAARKARADLEELEQLRRNHIELGELALKLRGLRKAQAQRQARENENANDVRKLESENAQLRSQVEQLKHAPTTAEARRSVDGTQLAQIAHYFRGYARNNGGKFPSDFAELKYYLPANVYPNIETDRFEILTGAAIGTSDPGQAPIVRTRFADEQNTRIFLFADGHVETRGGP
jgi:prepilin-type processing-associated H-X9-DG protein